MITFFLFLLVAIVFVLFFIVILSRLFGSNRKKFYRFCRIVSLASSFFVLAAILSLYLESNARFFTIPVTVEKKQGIYNCVFNTE